jgi:hypothetical protein
LKILNAELLFRKLIIWIFIILLSWSVGLFQKSIWGYRILQWGYRILQWGYRILQWGYRILQWGFRILRWGCFGI